MTNTKVFSSAQESMIADYLGWDVVSGSGAVACKPGDVKSYDWLGECKTHVKDTRKIQFRCDFWEKIKEEALTQHRKAVLFADNGLQNAENTWCLCNSSVLNKSNTLVIDFPYNVKKNLMLDPDTAYRYMKEEKAKSVGGSIPGNIFTDVIFEYEWNGEMVAIMPLATFKSMVDK